MMNGSVVTHSGMAFSPHQRSGEINQTIYHDRASLQSPRFEQTFVVGNRGETLLSGNQYLSGPSRQAEFDAILSEKGLRRNRLPRVVCNASRP